MAAANFTRLFSNSGLLSTGMKSTMLVALLFLLIGCGGTSPQLTPATHQTITAAQVFSNVAETWAFQDGYGDLMQIDVQPVDANHTIWHYTKNADRAYWMPNGQSAELYFFLERDSSGAWYSTGGHIIAPFGFPWDTTVPRPAQDFIYATTSTPGHPRPYLILADSGKGVDTVFLDTAGPDTPWITEMSAENGFLVSEQWEGSCPNQAHEKWSFKPGAGLWKVEPFTQGDCNNPTDPKLVMVRIN
jgi:hypothetical protein